MVGIDLLMPESAAERYELVDSYLASRGLTRPSRRFLSKPWDASSLGQRLQDARDAAAKGRRVALLVYERACGDDGTFRYFGYNIAQHLASSKGWVGEMLFLDELSRADELLGMASAVSLVRCRIRPELVDLVRTAKAAGARVAYMLDDDILGPETASYVASIMANDPDDPFERAFWKGVSIRFELASRLSEAIFAPTAHVAGILGHRSGKPAYVIHSSLSDEQVESADEAFAERRHATGDGRFVIGYFSGTSSHQDDFALVRDVLVRFLSEHDNACLLVGGHLGLDDELLGLRRDGKVIAMPHVDYVTLQYLQASADVVLAPLVDSPFSDCKSALKVFEAGAVGTPACASGAFAYREAIVPGRTGFVCTNEAEWADALERLHADRGLCNRMGEAARTRALARYHGDAIRHEVEAAFDALCMLPQAPVPDGLGATLASAAVENWDDPFEANPAFARDDLMEA
jgi:glycosyltransferase involved in cell wall biosynthesis